jgi:hypothetical protein
VSPASLRTLWEAPVQKEAPIVSLPVLAELKKTNREKDYAVIGELARQMENPRLEALYSRSARDLLRLAQDHPEAVREAAVERPLLSRVGQGRDEVERLLDEERRALIRKNEDRLDRYVEAAARWGSEWTRVSKEISGLPLTEAHEIVAARAAEYLPREP